MHRQSTLVVACFAALAGCGDKQAAVPNPNLVSCHAAGPLGKYAAPVTVRSDCWPEPSVQLVMCGTAPRNGESRSFMVRGGKAAVGALTRIDGPGGSVGCQMQLSLQDLGLECRGELTDAAQLPCFRGGDPKPVCTTAWTVTEPYDRYHPGGDFPRYIDDHQES